MWRKITQTLSDQTKWFIRRGRAIKYLHIQNIQLINFNPDYSPIANTVRKRKVFYFQVIRGETPNPWVKYISK